MRANYYRINASIVIRSQRIMFYLNEGRRVDLKKKKVIIALLLSICLLVFVFVYFTPISLISLPYTISNDNSTHSKIDISISNISFNGETVKDKINKEALVDLLSKYSCRRTLTWPSTYFIKDAWEISLNQGGEPLYIVLGETAFCYSSNNSVNREILDSKSLKQALNSMLYG